MIISFVKKCVFSKIRHELINYFKMGSRGKGVECGVIYPFKLTGLLRA
jgi:hypothetical protein